MDDADYEPVQGFKFDPFGLAVIAVELAEDMALAVASALLGTKSLLGSAYKWRLERQMYRDSMESLPQIIND